MALICSNKNQNLRIAILECLIRIKALNVFNENFNAAILDSCAILFNDSYSE